MKGFVERRLMWATTPTSSTRGTVPLAIGGKGLTAKASFGKPPIVEMAQKMDVNDQRFCAAAGGQIELL